MSNRRKLKQVNGGTLTRPRDQWGAGKLRTGERQGAGTASAVCDVLNVSGLLTERSKSLTRARARA
jgi:hypothetical protein